ncbi:MAG: dihydropteroate synthase, partial [Rhizobiaceae bacterium]
FGFAPSIDHDVPILSELERLHQMGFPILVGTSRKRFLGAITGREAHERGAATAATSVIARQKGAALFRVHDIEMNKDALAVTDAVLQGS